MKLTNYTSVILSAFLLAMLCGSAKAQNLPNKQTVGVKPPIKLRVDGKATEWNDQYQAYNSATEVYYSIANNDSIVTLVVHAVNPLVIQKILENGIGLTIFKNKADKRSSDVKILFPSLRFDDTWKILNGAGLPIAGFKKSPGAPKMSGDIDDILASQKEYSLAVANKQLTTLVKEIRFLGINAIKDTVPGITPNSPYYRNFSLRHDGYKYISVYNEDDILAAIQFDNKREMTYELSFPISYIKSNVSDGKFKYDITIHARDYSRPGVVVFYETPPNKGISFPELFNATNLQGEYTLAK